MHSPTLPRHFAQASHLRRVISSAIDMGLIAPLWCLGWAAGLLLLLSQGGLATQAEWLVSFLDQMAVYLFLALGWYTEHTRLCYGIAALYGLIHLFNLILFYQRGQTIGRWLTGLRLMRNDGERCSLSRYLFMRVLPLFIMMCIPVLGYLLIAVDAVMPFFGDRRSLRDRIAGTRVMPA